MSSWMSKNWLTMFFVAFFSFVCIQRLSETFARRRLVKGECFLRWSFPMMMVLHSAIFIGSVVEYFLVKRQINYVVSAVALGFYFFSLVLRNMAIRTLGRYFSLHIEIRKQHELVKEGVYQYVRHPIYLAVVIELLSVPLVANAYYTALVALFAYMPMLALRLHREELEMVEKFGDVYREYQHKTGALLPRLRQFRRI